jgi:hypothetical protein
MVSPEVGEERGLGVREGLASAGATRRDRRPPAVGHAAEGTWQPVAGEHLARTDLQPVLVAARCGGRRVEHRQRQRHVGGTFATTEPSGSTGT